MCFCIVCVFEGLAACVFRKSLVMCDAVQQNLYVSNGIFKAGGVFRMQGYVSFAELCDYW